MEYSVWLNRRDLSGVDLVVSDSQGGLIDAVRLRFQGATWQRRQTHLSANISDATPEALEGGVHRRAQTIF
jgi:putative transposase